VLSGIAAVYQRSRASLPSTSALGHRCRLPALSGIAAVYQETPPQVIFTRYGGLHVLVPGLSDTFPYDNGDNDNNNNNNNNTFSFHNMVLPISTCEQEHPPSSLRLLHG
jgi:hypothetical protein